MFGFKCQLILNYVFSMAMTSAFETTVYPRKKCFAPAICALSESSQHVWQQVFPPIGCEAAMWSDMAANLSAALEPMKNKIASLKLQLSALESDIQAANNTLGEALPKGWYEAPNRYLYQISSENTTGWETARNICRGMGGDIATVGMRDPRIEKFLFDFLSPLPINYWIGLTNVQEWTWSDGVPASPGESSPDGSQRCIALDVNFQWKMLNCDAKCGVVCEKGTI